MTPDAMQGLQVVASSIICCSQIMSLNCESQKAQDPTSSCTNTSRSFLLTLFYLFMLNIWFTESLTSREGKDSVSTVSNAPCWQVEQFFVAESCKECTRFEVKTREACSTTGYVEKINCSESQREEYKSCRSALMEETLFWRFEGTMLTLSIIFSVLVIHRQRALDRLASEKPPVNTRVSGWRLETLGLMKNVTNVSA
ncbi:protein JTB [Hemiscyllium ocellatum]|uniref:protein JTB n=1 Tax=Hemiscyllium ocellatum TaxID=170820 RepID=UPI002965F156|nr:protein JTB [Hemiscyllium ocellatum]